MINIIKKNEGKYVIYFFLFAAISSYLYSAITELYNGDFSKFEVNLSPTLLFINLIITITPILFLFICYIYFKKIRNNKNLILIDGNVITSLFYMLFIWKFLTSLVYGVGKMGEEVYEAPGSLTFILQITNRISLNFIFLILLFTTNNKKKIIGYSLLIIIYGLSRSSLSPIVFVLLSLSVKYATFFKYYLKKYFLILLVSIFLLPSIVNNLYNFRSYLRDSNEKVEYENVIINNVLGRLSSFSSSAQILENPVFFKFEMLTFDDFYFQKQALGGLISSKFLPKNMPEKMLIKSKFGENIETSAYMTGTQGNLLLSLFKSQKVFFINLFTVVLLIFTFFKIVDRFKLEYKHEISLMTLINPVVSGVAHEYSTIFFTPILLSFLFILNKILFKDHDKHN